MRLEHLHRLDVNVAVSDHFGLIVIPSAARNLLFAWELV
jgi:hypothetical protein